VRAVRFSEGSARVSEEPAPSGDGVRVRVASAGICGSDLHLLSFDMPTIVGHEIAGVLDDGTLVAVEPIAPCYQCRPCRNGEYNLCTVGPDMIMGIGQNGGMADECVVPASSIIPVPSGLSSKDACLAEPLAVAVHGVRRAQVAPDERVAVVGGGSIGQTALVAVQATGAAAALEARHDAQRSAAERLGAAPIGDGDYDVVIEAAGTSSALARAVELCRPGGRVVLLGSYWDGTVDIPAYAVSMKEINLIPSSMYGRVGPSRDFEVAVALLAARPEVPETIITHRFPLDAAAEAFTTAQDRESGAIKVVLEP
jgi:2-desacetyl-2-hydroxyethyl bacteriochlorophyllide A dehydrogenase